MNRLVCLNMPDELIARLDAVATTERRSRSAMARLIFESHLKPPIDQPDVGPSREIVPTVREVQNVV